MPLAAEIAEVLADGREEMGGMFTDVVRITMAGTTDGELGDLNEETGQYDTPPASVVVYHGPARMQVKADINSNVVETTAGDREWTYLTAQLQLPVIDPTHDPRYVEGSVSDVDVDNVCEFISVPHSPSLEGHVVNVAGPYGKSHPVYLRFRVREAVA